MARRSLGTELGVWIFTCLLSACAGPGADTDPISKSAIGTPEGSTPPPAVISAINLGTTHTRVEIESALRDEYDMRLSVTTTDDSENPAQSLTLVAPGGATLTADRSAVAQMDQIDPDLGIEIIRGFEASGNEGHWTLAAIASLHPDLFGDGVYTLTARFAEGSEFVELWYGEPGTRDPLPYPSNSGFISPDLSQSLTSPLTFTWDPDPRADYAAVFMAPVEGGQEIEETLPPSASSFGPHDYSPGMWGFELAIGVERQGAVDGVEFTISKGTVITLDREVN